MMRMSWNFSIFVAIFLSQYVFLCQPHSAPFTTTIRPIHRMNKNAVITNKIKNLKESINKLSDNESFPHFLAGMIAGAMECLVGHPLETLRVMTMTQNKGGRSLSTWTLFLQSLSVKGGFVDLYRGSVSELIGSALTSSYVYGANDYLKRIIGKSIEDDDFEKVDFKLLISASATGILDVIISKPLEMIKLRQQAAMETELIHASFGNRAKTLLQENGFFGLYRGWLPTVLREALGSLAYFATYQHVKNLLIDSISSASSREVNSEDNTSRNNHHNDRSKNHFESKGSKIRPRLRVLRPVISEAKEHRVSTNDRFLGVLESNLIVLVAGGAAGLLYVAITHPLDVLSVAMQIDSPLAVRSATTVAVDSVIGPSKSSIIGILTPLYDLTRRVGMRPQYRYQSMIQCAREVIRDQGFVCGLFKGFGPAVIRAVPCYSASLWSYEMALALCARLKVQN